MKADESFPCESNKKSLHFLCSLSQIKGHIEIVMNNVINEMSKICNPQQMVTLTRKWPELGNKPRLSSVLLTNL